MSDLRVSINIIAIKELTTKIARLCLQYPKTTAEVQTDITHLQTQIESLDKTLEHAKAAIEGAHVPTMTTPHELVHRLQECKAQLQRLRDMMDPGIVHKVMRRASLRAPKWPFTHRTIEGTVQALQRYEAIIREAFMLPTQSQLQRPASTSKYLSQQLANRTSIPFESHFNVPYSRNPEFVDRPIIQSWLRERHSMPSMRIALASPGGYGKSQLAVEFAYQIHTLHPETSIFWVHGGTKAEFEQSYRLIADTLSLLDSQDTSNDVVALVRERLESENAPPWLMILDDSHELESSPGFLQGQDPTFDTLRRLPRQGTGKLLYLTRSVSAAMELTNDREYIYEVPVMTVSEAYQLYRKRLGTKVDEEAVVELIQRLNGVPLAIDLAASYIKNHSPTISIPEYLGILQNFEEVENSMSISLGSVENVPLGVVLAWQASFRRLLETRKSAADLLRIMTFFSSHGIPKTITQACAEKPSGNEDIGPFVAGDVEALESFSFVKFLPASECYEMHPLVKSCTRQWMSASESTVQWETAYLELLCNGFPNGTFETWDACQSLLGHIQPLLAHCPVRKQGILHWAKLSTKVAWYLLQRGDSTVAEATILRAVEAGNNTNGDGFPDTLSTLAAIYRSQGRWNEAETIEGRVVESRRQTLGEEHPHTLAALGNLALTYRQQGNWDDAESIEVKVMETTRRTLGDEHPDTLSSFSNLASTLWMQSRLEEAEELEAKVLEIRQRTLGAEHPDTLKSMANLAATYWSQDRLDEAEDLQKKVASIIRRVLGEEHPDTLTSLGNLGTTLRCQGRLHEAKSLELQVMEARRRVLGENHPDTLTSVRNLVLTLRTLDSVER